MSVLRARTALDASAISSSRSPDHSGFFEHLNDSKLNYSISNYGYIYDEEREKLKLEIKELKDMVEMQELERLKLLKRIEEERNSKREEKKALFKQIEKLKRDAKVLLYQNKVSLDQGVVVYIYQREPNSKFPQHSS